MLRKIIFGLILLVLILGGILFFLFKYQEKKNPEIVNQTFGERVSEIFPVLNNKEEVDGNVSSTTEEIGENIGIDITQQKGRGLYQDYASYPKTQFLEQQLLKQS